MATAKTKGIDKADICKKLTSSLKKKYSAPGKYPALPVMETMLFAICLDNNSVEEAQVILDRVMAGFHDLNEMRVSSVEELEDRIHPASQSEIRAIRLRDVLHHVFEIEYKFEYEGLKRKTLEQAVKLLSKIQSLNWFTRAYVLHHCLGAHVLPVDDQMHAILCWLGLGVPGGSPEQTAEGLRGFVRKADGPDFCHVLKLCSLDPAYKTIIHNYQKIHDQGAWTDVPPLDRLTALLKGEFTRKKPPAKKGVSSSGAGKPREKNKAALTKAVKKKSPQPKKESAKPSKQAISRSVKKTATKPKAKASPPAKKRKSK